MNPLARLALMLGVIVGGAVLLGFAPWVVLIGLSVALMVWAFRVKETDR